MTKVVLGKVNTSVSAEKTSIMFLKVAFEALGYPLGKQHKAEILTGKY